MDPADEGWKDNKRPVSTIARNFSVALDSAFLLEPNLLDLSDSVAKKEQAVHSQKSELHELEARIREAEARLRERQALRSSTPSRRPPLPSQRTSSGTSIPRSRHPIEGAFQNPGLESSSEDQETTLPDTTPTSPRRQENIPTDESEDPGQGRNTTPNFSRPKSSASSIHGQGHRSQKSPTPASTPRHRESVSDSRAGGGRNSVSRGRA